LFVSHIAEKSAKIRKKKTTNAPEWLPMSEKDKGYTRSKARRLAITEHKGVCALTIEIKTYRTL